MAPHYETFIQFIEKVIGPIFPLIWMLLFFSVFNRQPFKKEKRLVRLLIIFLGSGLLIRFTHWHLYTRYSGRYTALIVIILIIYSAPGFFKFVAISYRKLKRKYPGIKYKYVFYSLLFLITLGCLGKSLRPQKSRPWQEDIYPVVHGALIDKTKDIILIPTKSDKRSAYYAKGRLLRFDILTRNYKNLIARYGTPNIFLMSYVPLKELPTELQVMPKKVVKVYHHKKKEITLYLLMPK